VVLFICTYFVVLAFLLNFFFDFNVSNVVYHERTGCKKIFLVEQRKFSKLSLMSCFLFNFDQKHKYI
jgi:hypothetical protein